MKTVVIGGAVPPSHCDLKPIELAIFKFAFTEELDAAGPEAVAAEAYSRAMERVRQFFHASLEAGEASLPRATAGR